MRPTYLVLNEVNNSARFGEPVGIRRSQDDGKKLAYAY
jgi:hypothetical protein